MYVVIPEFSPCLYVVIPEFSPCLYVVIPEFSSCLYVVFPEFSPCLCVVFPEFSLCLYVVIPEFSPCLYVVIPDDETYRVRLRKAKSLSFQGACLLEILRDFERNLFHIGLFTEDSKPQLIVKWQIDHVRQYGSNNQTFKFESGT